VVEEPEDQGFEFDMNDIEPEIFDLDGETEPATDSQETAEVDDVVVDETTEEDFDNSDNQTDSVDPAAED